MCLTITHVCRPYTRGALMETEGYQFEKCCEPSCTEDATFITMENGNLVCYCDAHGEAHHLQRGIPAEPKPAWRDFDPDGIMEEPR